MTLNFEAEAKTLRPRPECLEAKAEAEAKSSRPMPKSWPRGFNTSADNTENVKT